MYSLNRDTGHINWQAPVLDGVHYQSTTVANGVVYTIDGNGFLDAFNEANGHTLLKHQTSIDAGVLTVGSPTSNGVAIAENTVLVAIPSTTGGLLATVGSEAGAVLPPGQGSFLIAYRLAH
jgi:outer membrane protein assembly factor BamB